MWNWICVAIYDMYTVKKDILDKDIFSKCKIGFVLPHMSSMYTVRKDILNKDIFDKCKIGSVLPIMNILTIIDVTYYQKITIILVS